MKTLLIITSLFACLTTFAQTPDVAVGKAVYEFTHVRDTTNRDKPYKESFALLVGRNASVYKSLDKQLAIDRMMKDVAAQFKSAANPNAVDLNIKGPAVTTESEYYQFPKEKKFYSEEQLVNYYLVEEPLPVFKWTIKKDTASFSGLHCQLATSHFKGRDYEAWFCPDLPFQSGPWKLNGLPGLIIAANDTKKEVIFKFAGFEDISTQNQPIAPPKDDIKATPAQMETLKEARKKDPSGFMRAAHGSGQAKRNTGPMDNLDMSKIKSINVTKSDDSGNTRVINNPIELPEKR